MAVAHPTIVSLLPAATEIVFALELADNLLAVSHECNFPAGAFGKPKATFTHVQASRSSAAIDDEVKERAAVGQPMYGVDRALLGCLRPELVITQTQCDVCAVSYDEVVSILANESALSATRVMTLNPQRLTDVFADIERLGTETGRSHEAVTVVGSLRVRLENVRRTANAAVTAPPRVVCIEWIEPLMVAANWMPELVAIAGGVHGMTEAGQHTSYSRWQELTAYDPDIVIVAPCGFDLQRTLRESKSLAQTGAWNDLRAVRDGRAFAVDGDAYFNRSGPRLVDSVELLAGLLRDDVESTLSRFPGACCRL